MTLDPYGADAWTPGKPSDRLWKTGDDAPRFVAQPGAEAVPVTPPPACRIAVHRDGAWRECRKPAVSQVEALDGMVRLSPPTPGCAACIALLRAGPGRHLTINEFPLTTPF
jgi:hypothetical protein